MKFLKIILVLLSCFNMIFSKDIDVKDLTKLQAYYKDNINNNGATSPLFDNSALTSLTELNSIPDITHIPTNINWVMILANYDDVQMWQFNKLRIANIQYILIETLKQLDTDQKIQKCTDSSGQYTKFTGIYDRWISPCFKINSGGSSLMFTMKLIGSVSARSDMDFSIDVVPKITSDHIPIFDKLKPTGIFKIV
jgi:hypothetical protein